jgi:signal transduction histidine kinase
MDTNRISVYVEDSGPGIKSEDGDKVFQSRYTTKGVNGTGLGLYLSRQIVEVHGGKIEVSGKPGQGTTFTVQLPLNAREEHR